MNIVNLPADLEYLRMNMHFNYPTHNTQIFEEYFYYNFIKQRENLNVTYLPIFWTSTYCRRGVEDTYHDISSVVFNLDKSIPYFTIVQYDDNIFDDLSKLNILIFSSGGWGKYKEKAYPIPLLCLSPSNYEQRYPNKKIFSSFVGTIKGRHRIRESLKEMYGGISDYYFSEHVEYNRFIDVMRSTTFSLCPRGYGQTSFRICESLQNDSIPVYIYDDPIIPFYDKFDFNDIGMLVHESEIKDLDKKMRCVTKKQIEDYLANGKLIFKKYFSYNGCYNEIINHLRMLYPTIS